MTRIVSTSAALMCAAAIATLGLGCSSSDGSAGSGGSAGTGGTAGTGGAAGTGGDAGAGGDGGSAGMGGSASQGGIGGAGGGSMGCDNLDGRPVLTGQPSVTPMDPVAGSQVEVDLRVSPDTRVVRIVIADGFGAIGGEANVTTNTGGALTVTIDLVEDPTNFTYNLGILLCNEANADCLDSLGSASYVSYRAESGDGAGDPYFAVVVDNGASVPAESTFSCYDIVAFPIADAP